MSELNVGSTTDVYSSYSSAVTAESSPKETGEVKVEEASAVYEKSSENEKKATYSVNKMSAEERAALVEQLKQENENRKGQLISLIQQMLTKQGETLNLSELFTPDNLKNVTAEDIARAKEDISEDGYWGVSKTSQRMFDFASALAGDDVDKMKEMQEAMKKGFDNATKAWGKELPDICRQTIEAADKLFEDYYKSHEASAE